MFANALVDTGAEFSVVSEGLRRRLQNVRTEPSRISQCVAADKSVIQPVGQVVLNFELGPLRGHHTCIILTHASSEVIIGWDFMKRHRVRPNPVQNQLDVVGSTLHLPFESFPCEPRLIASAEASLILPLAEGLSDVQKFQLRQLLKADFFSSTDRPVGKARSWSFKIDTGNNSPINLPLRRTNPQEREIVRKEVASMLASSNTTL